MNIATMPLNELTCAATHLLCQEIGVVNSVRFINQFTVGYGDYSTDRDAIFDKLTVDEIVKEIKRERIAAE